MTLTWAFFYGLIQGITEFLPVSSSAHLALLPYFFKFKDPGVFFDLLMHLGTALAVSLYFYRDLINLFQEGILLLKSRKISSAPFFTNFVFATVMTVGMVFLLKPFAFSFGRNPLLMGINLIIFGLLMAFSDKMKIRKMDLEKQSKIKSALLIGFSQALAIFPGVSRSGATLTMGRTLGLSAYHAARFSFLLSLPIIFAGIIYKIPAMMNGSAIDVSWSVTLMGVGSSFLFGILTIHLFLKLLRKIGLWVFTLYRILLALVIFYFMF